MAAICKACANVEPEMSLKFFVPHLCERIKTILAERVNHKKSDHELQVSFPLMYCDIKGMQFYDRIFFLNEHEWKVN